MKSSLPRDDENCEKDPIQIEAHVAAIHDGTITLIAALRCSGVGQGPHRQQCFHHLHLYPARPEQPITMPQAKAFALHRGWEHRRCDGHRVWLCPDCFSQSV